jgi:hypothetical protein
VKDFNRLFDHLAQFLEDGPFILAMAAAVHQSRRTPDEALVLVRPLDNLRVPGAFSHGRDSSIALRAASSGEMSNSCYLLRMQYFNTPMNAWLVAGRTHCCRLVVPHALAPQAFIPVAGAQTWPVLSRARSAAFANG